MSSYEGFVSEMMEDFSSSLGSEWSAEERELAKALIAEVCARFEGEYRSIADAEHDHFDKQEIVDFVGEVEEEIRLVLGVHDLI